MRKFTRWSRLFKRWIKIILGKSYYHQPQGLGKAFYPGELAGYFNDLTSKTYWAGYIDDEGIPVNILDDGRKVYFATTVVQKALGHWDKWILNNSETEKNEFLKLCQWLLKHQDIRGGWPIWQDLKLPLLSPYSAMTQGECVSAFVRAWKLTGTLEFAEGARRAVDLMLIRIEEGGPAVWGGETLFLEEAPSSPRSSILNGWIFALFGLYDFYLAFQEKKIGEHFRCSLNTLKKSLPDYDAGYWSFYDRLGHLSSFFYHDLHIHQLTALMMIDDDPILCEFRDRFLAYKQVTKNRVKAFITKAWQKLHNPGEGVVVR